jgi:hypothetical protein
MRLQKINSIPDFRQGEKVVYNSKGCEIRLVEIEDMLTDRGEYLKEFLDLGIGLSMLDRDTIVEFNKIAKKDQRELVKLYDRDRSVFDKIKLMIHNSEKLMQMSNGRFNPFNTIDRFSNDFLRDDFFMTAYNMDELEEIKTFLFGLKEDNI